MSAIKRSWGARSSTVSSCFRCRRISWVAYMPQAVLQLREFSASGQQHDMSKTCQSSIHLSTTSKTHLDLGLPNVSMSLFAIPNKYSCPHVKYTDGSMQGRFPECSLLRNGWKLGSISRESHLLKRRNTLSSSSMQIKLFAWDCVKIWAVWGADKQMSGRETQNV